MPGSTDFDVIVHERSGCRLLLPHHPYPPNPQPLTLTSSRTLRSSSPGSRWRLSAASEMAMTLHPRIFAWGLECGSAKIQRISVRLFPSSSELSRTVRRQPHRDLARRRAGGGRMEVRRREADLRGGAGPDSSLCRCGEGGAHWNTGREVASPPLRSGSAACSSDAWCWPRWEGRLMNMEGASNGTALQQWSVMCDGTIRLSKDKSR